MSNCNHSDRVVCMNCAESDIFAEPWKPMKGTLSGDAEELAEEMRNLADALVDAWVEVWTPVRKNLLEAFGGFGR